jgi:PDZ domain-containing protein
MALVAVLAATALILYSIPSDQYILLPDVAHPVAPLVQVEGGKAGRGPGAVYFVDVVERRASELEALFPWLHSHATLLPADLIVPPGANSSAVQQAELRQMSISQRVAAAVALRRLGYHVVVHPDGVIVKFVDLGTHAYGKLQASDVIVAVDDTPTPTIARLRDVLSHVKPGSTVDVRIRRGNDVLTEQIATIADPRQGGRAIIGFEPAQSAKIKLPIRVSIDAGGIGGPSAGLAFALEVMKKLGRDVTHGHRVAATGEMGLNGTVSPIGGVEQKTYGARAANADVFLVPAGENATTARRYAGPLRIIPVRTLAQALHALATLPPEG